MPSIKPFMLIILDGWGYRPARQGNAFALAQTPFLDHLRAEYPTTRLLCSGKSVGLPDHFMGNSEVGHLNIGAGRVVFQDLLRINTAIGDGSFAQNKALNNILSQVKAAQSILHLIGLVSDGGVHSHINHLLALVDLACAKGVPQICVHALLDGRDTPPDSGKGYIHTLQKHLSGCRAGRIASICGRYYAMDRDQRWERVAKAYRLFTQAEGIPERDPITAVANAYQRDETDEFIKPIAMLNQNRKPIGTVNDGDGIIFFNFRADRARQITRAFTGVDFALFPRNPLPRLCGYVCMTRYDETFHLPVAFLPTHLTHILGEVISKQGLRQLRVAETEKYAHVTYFFNGGAEAPFTLEDRCLIPSPRDVPTYDLKPEMSALQVTEEVLTRIRSDKYHFIVLNFANMDMVGHSGNLEAAIKACETVDQCLKKIVDEAWNHSGTAIITADHGNAEQMLAGNGKIHTAHTQNPVPLILVDDTRKGIRLREGILADIAPTLLELMGIPQPSQMTGQSLLVSSY